MDHEGFGAVGNAALVLMELGGEEVDGGAADGGGSLVEAGDGGVIGAPIEGGETGFDGKGDVVEPGGQVAAGLEDDLGA